MQLPDKQTLSDFARYYLIASIVFIVVYGATNYLTLQRADRLHLYFTWELNLPFIPQFIYGYLSILLIFVLPLISLRSTQLRALCIAFTGATCVAGLIYLVLPAELAHKRPDTAPSPQFLFASLYRFALPHNLFPSLHITYSTLILLAITHQERDKIYSAIAIVWMTLICASVILVRQHQVVDIISGWLLGWLTYHFVYRGKWKSLL